MGLPQLPQRPVGGISMKQSGHTGRARSGVKAGRGPVSSRRGAPGTRFEEALSLRDVGAAAAGSIGFAGAAGAW